MKVLIINANWTGASTGKIAYGFYNELKKNGHEAVLAYGMGKENYVDKHVIRIAPRIEPKIHFRVNLITGYHGEFGPVAHYNLKKIIADFKPDIIQLYNLHGYYVNITKLLKYIAQIKIPVVYGMLDEYPYLGYCCYAFDCMQFKTGCKNCENDFKERYMKTLFFNRARESLLRKKRCYDAIEKIVFTGPEWVIKRAKESVLLCDKKLEIIDEYVDNDKTFVPRNTDKLKKSLSIGEEKIIILDVAPSGDSRKGVGYFIELAKKFEGLDDRYLFINVGYEGDREILPGNFMGIGYVQNQEELAKYYSMADLFVCTSFADTMPNTCLDALSCGTPVCGFDITGVPYVAEKPCGQFVEPGNIEELENIVMRTNHKTSEIIEGCREYALKRYSLKTYYEKQMAIYHESIGEANEGTNSSICV